MQCIVTYVLVCIHRCVKSVLIYKYLILVTHYPDTLYLREDGWENL
jgi:hypothetical protein